MAESHYAWSPILYGADVDEKTGVVMKVKRMEFGDKVTKSGLGVSDEDWDALVDSGAVRNYAPPKLPEGFQGSVIEHLQNEIKRAGEEGEAAAAMALGGSYHGPNAEETSMAALEEEGK